MKRIVLLLALACALIGTASVALADPHLTNVAAHRHFLQTENGLVAVGPNLCDDSSLQNAFNQFHANLHTHAGLTGAIGPVAPGLHNGSGPEIVARGCSFVP